MECQRDGKWLISKDATLDDIDLVRQWLEQMGLPPLKAYNKIKRHK